MQKKKPGGLRRFRYIVNGKMEYVCQYWFGNDFISTIKKTNKVEDKLVEQGESCSDSDPQNNLFLCVSLDSCKNVKPSFFANIVTCTHKHRLPLNLEYGGVKVS